VQLYRSVSDCKGVGNNLGSHFVKAFSVSRLILMTTVASQKRLPFIANFSQGSRYKSAAARSMGDAAVSSHCSLLRNPRPKAAGVLEHCREGESNRWFPISVRFLLTPSLRRRRIPMYIPSFTVAVPENYTSEFREHLEATMYVCPDCSYSVYVNATIELLS
jgi:hypothetical protein